MHTRAAGEHGLPGAGGIYSEWGECAKTGDDYLGHVELLGLKDFSGMEDGGGTAAAAPTCSVSGLGAFDVGHRITHGLQVLGILVGN